MNVLSIFDGMSCGQLALPPCNYFASEIDKNAIKITQKNFPNTTQLGDCQDYQTWDLPQIDLLLGGSPCQDLSITRHGKGLDGEKSKLFYTFVEILNKFKPKHFLLENVPMRQESIDIISSHLGVQPIEIDSARFSAQTRKRLYWTNLNKKSVLSNDSRVVKDILQDNVPEKYFYKTDFEIIDESKHVCAKLIYNGHDILKRIYNINYKSPTLTAVTGGNHQKKILIDGRVRKLTPMEYERLQTVPDGYTEGVSDTARYSMLGNGWTVDVIKHLLT